MVVTTHVKSPRALAQTRRWAEPGSKSAALWATDPRAGRESAHRPRYWTWAALMRPAFGLDVLSCPRCAGRMQLIATIDDPAVIRRIFAHLGLPGARAGPPSPFSGSAARAEQQALPDMTL